MKMRLDEVGIMNDKAHQIGKNKERATMETEGGQWSDKDSQELRDETEVVCILPSQLLKVIGGCTRKVTRS